MKKQKRQGKTKHETITDRRKDAPYPYKSTIPARKTKSK